MSPPRPPLTCTIIVNLTPRYDIHVFEMVNPAIVESLPDVHVYSEGGLIYVEDEIFSKDTAFEVALQLTKFLDDLYVDFKLLLWRGHKITGLGA